MNFVALKMLVGDRAKYPGIIMGLTFASLLICIFASLISIRKVMRLEPAIVFKG